ncbi:NAD-binding protein [Pseudomonas purpurea]|uniref:NAD-binding protein n=1 Tax=Pseudomonas purpurea TaxID=3136737 RepID=UPI0032634A9A
MKTIEGLLDNTPVSKRLNYLNAHRIAEHFYRQVLNAHKASGNDSLGNCLIFCFSHLSTTVNLSICNNWLGMFDKIYLIPKKGSLNANLLMHISDPTRVMKARDRKAFSKTVNEIGSLTRNSDLPVIIFDIGGYFAPYIDEISASLGERLLLVLEDTANGHKKYQDTQYFANRRRFKSVAYDAYKMAENVMVATIMLAHLPSFITEWSKYKPALVVGYGRIGRSLCFGLRERGVTDIVVVDSDKARLFMAATEGFEALTHAELGLYACYFEYCFSMSGQHGVTKKVVSAINDNGYISVVTSYDDEFDQELMECFESGDGSSIVLDGKKINIVNKGRPINLSSHAAFDARNLSLHFIFGKILSSFLISLGMDLSADWEGEVYSDIFGEIR